MADEIKRLSIFFMDGTSLTVEFPVQVPGADNVAVASYFRKLFEGTVMGKFLPLEIDGDLILIPWENVKYFQLSPGPKAFPEGAVIRGVRLVQ
jgi:hypothetical protein